MLTRQALYALWFLHRDRPGWLSDLSARLRLSRWQEQSLGDMEEQFLRAVRDLEDSWRKDVGQRVRDFRDEFGPTGREHRKAYLQAESGRIRQEIARIHKDYEAWAAEGLTTEERLFRYHGSGAPEMDSQLRKIESELRAFDSPEGRITEQQIERARSRRLEEFVEVRKGYILCPLHDDRKPSMWVKNGFGHCFSCQGTLDAIGYMTKVRGLSFPEAIKSLQ